MKPETSAFTSVCFKGHSMIPPSSCTIRSAPWVTPFSAADDFSEAALAESVASDIDTNTIQPSGSGKRIKRDMAGSFGKETGQSAQTGRFALGENVDSPFGRRQFAVSSGRG